jgi:hypothetical protein
MEDSQLSPELERVERLLAFGPRSAPSMALRRRVLDDVRAEMRRHVLDHLRTELRREQVRSSWWFAAACAATLLVGAGLSLSVMHAAGFALRPRASTPTVYDVARRLQQLSPEVSREDSLRQAMLRHVGAEASCGAAPNNTILAEPQSHDP